MTASGTLRDIGNAAVFGVGTARTGGDIFNLSGKTLTIDEDTRYGKSGLSGGVSGHFHLAGITSSATLGGDLNIDGRYVRMIPFTSGSGTIIPGNVITCGSATGVVIGIYSAMNAAPALTGVATGWIKVTAWNGVTFPTSGSYTQAGYTFTINGASIVGFIEVVGQETKTATIPRLGSVNITGEWFEAGYTLGGYLDTYQLPTNGNTHHFAGVFVEKTAFAGDFEFYACAGSLAGANYIGTDSERGRVCWISTAGVLKFGYDGANLIGHVPTAGRRIVIPNVILTNCATATGATNAVPNATLASRYDFTTTSGGSISIDKAMCAWYPSFAKASSVTISNTAINEQLYLDGIGGETTLTQLGIGVTAAQSQTAFYCTGGSGGFTLTDCAFVTLTAHSFFATDVNGLVTTRCRTTVLVNDGARYARYLARCSNFEFNSDTSIDGVYSYISYCSDITFNDFRYGSRIGTARGRQGTALTLDTSNARTKVSGFSLIDADGYPATRLFYIAMYSNQDSEFTNIGSQATPIEFGGVCSTILQVGGTYCSGIKLRRAWVNNQASGTNLLPAASTTSKDVEFSNIYVSGTNGYLYQISAQNNLCRALRISSVPSGTPATLAYGTHWTDYFTSDTVGRLRLEMNEPSAETASFVSVSGGAEFTGAGGVYMPVVGQTATFEMNYFALGHTGFDASAATMEGGTATNYTYRYQLNKNDGAGWSAWSTSKATLALLATALNAETGLDATLGTKLKLEVTTGTANSTAIAAINIYTTTTATAQQTLYPLASTDFTFSVKDTSNAAVTGFEWRLYLKDPVAGILGSTELAGAEYLASSGATFTHQYASDTDVVLQILKDGYVESTSEYVLNTTPISATIYLTPDYN